MKSLFNRQMFQVDFAPRRLSQANVFNVFGDLLQDFGVSEKEIDELISKLPATDAGAYRARLDECKAMGLTSSEGAACLYKLFQDLKAGTLSQKTPTPTPRPATQPSSFPVVPVVIVAVVLAGIGIYFAVKK